MRSLSESPEAHWQAAEKLLSLRQPSSRPNLPLATQNLKLGLGI
jgi:hypothetical protein